MRLTSITQSLTVVLGGTPTGQLPWTATVESLNVGPSNGINSPIASEVTYAGQTASVVAVTMVPVQVGTGPSGVSPIRPARLAFLSVHNPTGNSSATVTLTLADSAGTARIVAKMALAVGDTMYFTPERGFYVISSAGSVKGSAAAAAAANVAALTDSSGGAAADGTIGAVTAPSALTDSTGGSASTTLAAETVFTPSVSWNGSSVYPSAADATAIGAINTAQKNAIASIAARQAENRTAIIALKDAITELATTLNAEIAAMKTAGLQASS